MISDRTFLVSNSLVRIILLPFLWLGFMSGLFALLTNQTTEGIIWIAAVILALGVILQGSILNKIEGKRLPIGSVVLWGGITVLIAIDEIMNIVYNKITVAGEVYIPNIIALISSIGFVIIAIIVIFKLVNLFRNSE